MSQEEKTKVKRVPQKHVHFDCDKDLYKQFKAKCNNNGKTVSACLRAYMKLYIGDDI